jgi:tRNA wybutosine-synthesizing protein 3
MLLGESDKKPEVKWWYVSHELTTFDAVWDALQDLPQERVWLRQENLIFHIACRTLEDAERLLKIARDIGLRRSGIIADSNVIIVEICSTERMDVPLAEKGKLLVDREYIQFIVDIANEKFLKGRERLKKLEEEIRQQLHNQCDHSYRGGLP